MPLPIARPVSKAHRILYWICTALIVYELINGALWDFNVLNKGYVYGTLDHLGYPPYLGDMLGACKLAAAAVFLAPGMRLVKEWAYTGIVILFLGAFASHTIAGDGPAQSIWPLLFAGITTASWALRPAGRRIEDHRFFAGRDGKMPNPASL